MKVRTFRSLASSFNDIIYTLDAQQRHTGVYGDWVEKTGLTPEFFLGKTARDIFGAEVQPMFMNKPIITPLLARQQFMNGLRRLPLAFHILNRSLRCKVPGRNYWHCRSGARHHRAQAGGRGPAESEIKFRQTFDISPVGIVMVGLDKRFIHCNLAFSQSLGYETEELVGKLIEDVTLPEDKQIGMAEMMAIMKGEIAKSQVHKRYLRKDGQVIWGEVTISLIRDSGRARSIFPRHHPGYHRAQANGRCV